MMTKESIASQSAILKLWNYFGMKSQKYIDPPISLGIDIKPLRNIKK